MAATFDHSRGITIRSDQASLFVQEKGLRDRPPLVLLHGGMGHSGDFDPIVNALAQRFRTIGIDARGHGQSTLGTATLTYAQLERDVLTVLDHLELERASVLGFSDGGIVGYRLAMHAPARVERLVTLGAPCRLTPATAKILQAVTPESWDKKFPQTRIDYERLNPEPDFAGFVRASVRMWLDTGSTGYPQSAIGNIKQPTLLVRGDDDHLFSLEESVELRRSIASSHLLNVPFAGHVVFAEQTDACLAAIALFFDRS